MSTYLVTRSIKRGRRVVCCDPKAVKKGKQRVHRASRRKVRSALKRGVEDIGALPTKRYTGRDIY